MQRFMYKREACMPIQSQLLSRVHGSLSFHLPLISQRSNLVQLSHARVYHSTPFRSAASGSAASSTPSYSHTMLLPKTEFPQHVKNVHLREQELQKLCSESVYQWQLQSTSNGPSFLLHDGPPFANGRLHLGHFMNKALKDFINRYKMMRGYKINYVPGWDCHGLPIEVKALDLLKSTTGAADIRLLSAQEIRTHARKFAEGAIQEQKDAFRKWGVMGSWEKPYITMSHAYESAQLGVFATMVSRGLIYRGLKPVYWSPVSRTALAEAELEYADEHVSPSLYVSFPITNLSTSAEAAGLSLSKFPGIRALIWTTTPWTLPSNLAISYHKDLEYAVVKVGPKLASAANPTPPPAAPEKGKQQPKKPDVEEGTTVEGSLFLIGVDRINEVIGGVLKREVEVLATVKGEVLAGSAATHPFYPRASPFISGSHVTIEAGTALVHTAPAHGMDDFQVCREHGIQEVLCPVDADGNYTSEIGLSELAGQNVLKGANKHVIALLQTKGALVQVNKLVHRYPYDWRSKTPVIQRATEQWFCKLEAIQSDALESLKNVQFYPPTGRARLQAMIEGRKEWCISRQRHWGVPIPVFYNTKDNSPLLTNESVDHIRSLFEKHGSDCWWSLSVEELLAPQYRDDGNTYTKGVDTMDVWFDSGCSWRAVVQNQIGSTACADVYLEGSDQHRGWFQSSLLTSVAAAKQAPYKAIITHGFLLDENLRKMSKSLGNVVDPVTLIQGEPSQSIEDAPATAAPAATEGKKGGKVKKAPAVKKAGEPVGVDLLRLWVCSTDYNNDVAFGKTVMGKMSDALKKLRLSARFLLGCLDGFEQHHMVPLQQLKQTDQYLLHLLSTYAQQITASYEDYNFKEVFAQMQSFNSTQLSAFFLDINKDRLYADSKESASRRAAQTALFYSLVILTKSFAPVLPHLAEDVYQHVPSSLRSFFHANASTHKAESADSLFMHGWMNIHIEWSNESLANRFGTARRVRSHVTKLLEQLRQEHKALSNFSEADITIEVDSQSGVSRELISLGEELNLVFNTASVRIREPTAAAESKHNPVWSLTVNEVDSKNESTQIVVRFQPAVGSKCPRCWKISSDISEKQACCSRCTALLSASPI